MSTAFAAFMEEALYGAEGYYTRGVNFSTVPPRDFTTAPELTPLFGATLANAAAAQWRVVGKPVGWVLTEMGPGRGSLMRALLVHLQEAHGACFQALQQVRLIEISPTLRTLQQATLKDFPLCVWPEDLGAVQGYHMLIGNEVLDALPVQPYRFKAGAWEALGVQEGALVWEACKAPALPTDWHPAEGAVLETMPALPALLKAIKAHADVAWLIDYGYESLPPTGADTLQALHMHQKVNLLHKVGDTDLTAHVNFEKVVVLLGEDKCALRPLADFLLANGLPDLALPLLPHPATESALHRLLHPSQMGTLHKVLCFTRSTL